MRSIIGKSTITRRSYWVDEIRKLSGIFGDDQERLAKELKLEINGNDNGREVIIDHLRLCGDIPEFYGHDTTEEKLYSKYTDIVIAEAFSAIGFKSNVLRERGDAADVEVFGNDYSFVADAKAFRLSRTAKNQKDFKIQAMDGWKRGKPYAMVVCPIYQLPTKASQIYEQASARNVCIFTYSHLAMILTFSSVAGNKKAEDLVHKILKIIPALNPSKDAFQYWLSVNKTMLDFSKDIEELWKIEKQVAVETIEIAKEEALRFLAMEREKIMRMGHEDALRELIKAHKIENKIKVIESLSNNGILEIR